MNEFDSYKAVASKRFPKSIDHSKPKTILDFEEVSLEETNRYLLKKLNIAREHFWNFVYYVKEDFSDFEVKILNIVCENCDAVLANNEDFCSNCNKPASEKKVSANCAGKGRRKCINCDNYIPSRATYCKHCKYDYKTNTLLDKLPVIKAPSISKIKKKKKHVNIKINAISDVSVLIENDRTLNNVSLFNDLSKNKNLQKLFDESSKLAYRCIIQSKNELVKLNLNLVRNVAQKIMYAKSRKLKHLKIEDLIQEGNIGLLKAIDKFDVNRTYTKSDNEEKEISFSTYATYWITKEILKSIIVKDKIIRLPDHIINKYKNFQQFYFDYINKNLEAPTLETLIRELKLSKKNVEALLFAINQTDYVNLDAQVECFDSEINENILILQLFNLGLYHSDNYEMLNNIRSTIDSIKFKKQVYKEAFIDMFSLNGKEYSLDEIAEKYDISKVTLIKIRDTTLDKLKKKITMEDWGN